MTEAETMRDDEPRQPTVFEGDIDPAARDEAARHAPISLPVLDEKSKGLEPKPKKPLTKKPIFWIGMVVLIALLVGAFLYWQSARQWESTDDAFVDAHIVRVAPQVAGILTQVPAVDNAHVRPGDLLAVIEGAAPTATLQQAQADLAQANGALAQAQAQREQALASVAASQATTRQQLANIGVPLADAEKARRDLARYLEAQRANPAAVAGITIDQARAAAQQADAQIAAARAQAANAGANASVSQRQVRAAEAAIRAQRANVAANEAKVASANVTINNLKLYAPVAGHVANRTVNVGSYVAPGTQIMAVVPDAIWVTANFKETQLAHMRIGQKVEIKVDALPSVKFDGHVDSFQRGAGQAFQLLPAENATGNFVKVVQRVAVRIVFDKPDPAQFPIGPGMSVSPRVKVR